MGGTVKLRIPQSPTVRGCQSRAYQTRLFVSISRLFANGKALFESKAPNGKAKKDEGVGKEECGRHEY